MKIFFTGLKKINLPSLLSYHSILDVNALLLPINSGLQFASTPSGIINVVICHNI